MEYSKYQKDIFREIELGERSLVINALAGSGKTTTLIDCLKMISKKEKVLFLAFNKSIAEELVRRCPSHVTVRTLNALGHMAWGRHIGENPILDAQKTYSILKNNDFLETLPRGYEFYAKKFSGKIKRLVSLAKAHGIVPNSYSECSGGLMEDSFEVWRELAKLYDISFVSEEEVIMLRPEVRQAKDMEALIVCSEIARSVLKYGIEMAVSLGVIDFDDQLYLPVIHRIKMDKYDWVFVDEAQDISGIQRKLIHGVLKKPSGRVVACGDKNQAIYGFRAASQSSLDLIKEEFNCLELPLSISYRCPKAVVAEAKKLVPAIEHAPLAKEGSIIYFGEINSGNYQKALKPGDMVVCRNNSPLVSLCLSLVSQGIPAFVSGRDFGGSLSSLVEKLKPKDNQDLLFKLGKWREREITRVLSDDPEANLDPIEEKVACLKIFLEKASSPVEIVSNINKMFIDTSPESVISLCTIHKSKGLERNRVIFLNSHLIPSKYAKTKEQIQSEMNLSYVAITRAKEALIYANLPPKKR